jgi:membrane-bound ClpP family serine protease
MRWIHIPVCSVGISLVVYGLYGAGLLGSKDNAQLIASGAILVMISLVTRSYEKHP